MKHILTIHAIVEILAGFLILFNPKWLLMNSEPNIQGMATAKIYGIAAFCFGIFSFLINKQFEYTKIFKQLIMVVIAFHVAIGFSLYGYFAQFITPFIYGSIFHLCLALIFVVLYMNDVKKIESNENSAK